MNLKTKEIIIVQDNSRGFPVNLFSGLGSEVSIQRIVYSSYSGVYLLAQDLGNDKYFTTMLAGTMSVGGEFMRMILPNVSRLLGAYNRNNGVSVSGTWTPSISDAQWGGRQDVTSATNAYAEIVTPDGVTEVGLYGINTSNAGIQRVSIDGNNTLADLLPT